jgi:hypothetical protein
MSGTGAGGQAHPQPPIAPIVTLGPTTPKPDKSLQELCSISVGELIAMPTMRLR